MLNSVGAVNIDFGIVWTWFLLFARTSGIFSSMPGIGTAEIPGIFRNAAAMMLSIGLALTGIQAQTPDNLIDGGVMIGTEFVLGWAIGIVPAMIMGGLGVAGQVTTGAIGLGQANMIDPSLGGSVAVLARIEAMIGALIFLVIDGHHAVIRAAAGLYSELSIGTFRPGEAAANLLVDRFLDSFELAVIVSAPILVTILVTQFVLGLITRFVPQVNIFIISLPLTIMVGLYIFAYTMDGLAGHVIYELKSVEEFATLLTAR